MKAGLIKFVHNQPRRLVPRLHSRGYEGRRGARSGFSINRMIMYCGMSDEMDDKV